MSEETRIRVTIAETNLAEIQGPIDEAKSALLDAIQQNLPDYLESSGKKYAQSQPEVTKRLGAQGVKEFRIELRELGKSVAQDLRTSTKITWPMEPYGLTDTRMRVRNAFQKALEKPLHELENLLTKHGFDINRSDNYSDVSVWDVCDAGRYEVEAEAYMNAIAPLRHALREVNESRKADEAAIVNDLWGDD